MRARTRFSGAGSRIEVHTTSALRVLRTEIIEIECCDLGCACEREEEGGCELHFGLL
jgi:hypothetical protein